MEEFDAPQEHGVKQMRETIDICSYSIVIKDGRILDKGEKDYLTNSTLIREEYFGKVFD